MTETPRGNHEERKPQPSKLGKRRRDLEQLDDLERGIQDARPRARSWNGSRRWWLFGGVATIIVLQALFPQYMFRRYHPGDSVFLPISFEILAMLAAIAVGHFVLGRRSGF